MLTRGLACAVIVIATSLPVAPSPSPVAPSPSASQAGLAAFAACSVISADEATQVLGYDVSPPDRAARAGGNCFFASQAMSQDGSVSYALVNAERLVTLRPYFIALARRCAGVAPSSPRAAACAMFRKLAAVTDVDGYYAARTAVPEAELVAGLGDDATSAGGTLFVRQGGAIVEAAVRRDGAFDLARSETLARVLLGRLRDGSPEPSPSGV